MVWYLGSTIRGKYQKYRPPLAMRRREFIGLVGGVAAWPIVARAQQPKKIIPTVGVLWHAASKEEEGILYTSMHEGFAALGYISGKNVVFEERFPGEIE